MGPDGGRRVTVVLCNQAGELLGALPPLDLEEPWFPGVIDVVEAVRDTFGLCVTVLRLLDADRPPGQAGSARIVYLAQLDGRADVPDQVPLAPVPRLPAHALADQPLREAYARPGGPGADLAWADRALAAGGMPRTGRPRQVRTWNLSCIWQIPTSGGDVWLKVVPPFFRHEGAMIALLGGVTEAVPPLLAHEPGRVLLADVPGHDCYRAATPMLRRMIPVLVEAQAALVGRTAELLGTGAFDWRPGAFEPPAHDVVERTADALSAADRAQLAALLSGLPGRLAAVADCGIPDTLVHGDFHPGNVRVRSAQGDHGADDGAGGHAVAGGLDVNGVRGDVGAPGSAAGESLVILDWGDSGVGNPLLDQAAFLESVPAADRPLIAAEWSAAWRSTVPGCDPGRAAALLAPVAALRQAVIYRLFLDRIEPSERVYHEADPSEALARAAALARW